MQRAWTDEEAKALRQLDPGLSVANLVAAFNAIAQERGWPLRSESSIRKKRLTQRKPVRQRWTAVELAQLDDLIGDRSLEMVRNAYNKWARANGYPERSQKAIQRKASRLGLDTHPQGNWVHSGTVARLLRKCSRTISNWVRQGWVRRNGHNWQSVLWRADLRKLARKKPHFFGGVPWDDLFWVLEDAELVDEILAAYPHRWSGRNSTTAVVCITNARRFPSIRAAAEAHYISPSAVSYALAEDRPVAGLRFRKAG